MAPIEGSGVLAEWDPRLEQMIVTTSTQMPHVTKTGLADCLGLDEGQVRIVSPDVGGGFGYKGILLPEEIVCASLAMRLGRPVRWLEDRFEQLTANANCREHHYVITAWADRAGKLLGVECEATVDAGAYSVLSLRRLPGSGPDRLDPARALRAAAAALPHHLRLHQQAADPALSRRGADRRVLRHGDHARRRWRASSASRRTPIRLANLVPPEAMPYRNLVGKVFDSGDYPEVAAPRRRGLRSRRHPRAPGARARRSASASPSSASRARTAPRSITAGASPSCRASSRPCARSPPMACWKLRVGVHSHGQGMETTLAQVAHEILGVHPAKVRVVHGDTALRPIRPAPGAAAPW